MTMAGVTSLLSGLRYGLVCVIHGMRRRVRDDSEGWDCDEWSVGTVLRPRVQGALVSLRWKDCDHGRIYYGLLK